MRSRRLPVISSTLVSALRDGAVLEGYYGSRGIGAVAEEAKVLIETEWLKSTAAVDLADGIADATARALAHRAWCSQHLRSAARAGRGRWGVISQAWYLILAGHHRRGDQRHALAASRMDAQEKRVVEIMKKEIAALTLMLRGDCAMGAALRERAVGAPFPVTPTDHPHARTNGTQPITNLGRLPWQTS